METKETKNLSIMSKNGTVKSINIQRHRPECDMKLIVLEDGFSLFCQENHPLIVNRRGYDKPIITEAKNIYSDDMIWTSNIEFFNSNSIIDEELDQEIALNMDEVISKIKKYCSFDLDPIIYFSEEENKIFKGNTVYNFRFNNKIFSLSEDVMSVILDGLFLNNNSFWVYSYNFVQQIKILSDLCGYSFEILEVDDSDNIKGVRFKISSKYVNESYGMSYKYRNIIKEYTIKNWKDFVYDIHTESEDLLIGGSHSHNSFHCLHGEQLVYMKDDNKNKFIITLKDMWLENKNDIDLINEQEEKTCNNLYVWDKNVFTKVNKIIRHKKDGNSNMVFLRNRGADFVISQDNHPHMLSKNNSICLDCNIPYIRPRNPGNWYCPNCKKKVRTVNHKNSNKYEKIKPKDIIKSLYFSYNSFPIWEQENCIKNPIINSYLLGLFLSEGSFLYQRNVKKEYCLSGIIFHQKNKEIHKSIVDKLLLNGLNPIINKKSPFTIIIYDKTLAFNLLKETKRYSYEKIIPFDFITYSEEDLSKILCGFIDGDGSCVVDNQFPYISIETTSVVMLQQFHHILKKFQVNHNIFVAPVKKLTNHQIYVLKIYPCIKDVDYFKYSIKFQKIESLLRSTKINKKNENLVTYVKSILFDEEDYVYDLNTESGTLTTNGIWTHNTGAAVSIKRFDIIEDIGKNINSETLSFLKSTTFQKEDDLYAISDTNYSIEIDKNLYSKFEGYEITRDNNFITLKVGYFVIQIGAAKMKASIEQLVNINIENKDIIETSRKIIINYKKGDKILNCPPSNLQPQEVANMVDKLIGGKSPWETPEQLYIKLYSILSKIKNWDSVHLECAISNILRNKTNPQIPARLKEPYDPITFSVKKLPGVISWPLAFSFENFSEAIKFGLTSDRAPSSKIEKLFFGEPMSPLYDEYMKKLKKSQ